MIRRAHRCDCCGLISHRVARGVCPACVAWGGRATEPASCRACRHAKASGPVPLPGAAEATAPQRVWTYALIGPDGQILGTGGCGEVTLPLVVAATLRAYPPGAEVRCHVAGCDEHGLRFWLDAETAETRSAEIERPS